MSKHNFKHLMPDFNTYYEKGGGGGQMAMMMMMMQQQKEEAARQDRMENQRKIDAKNETKRIADEKAGNISKSQGRVSAAYNSALDYGRNQLTSKGVSGSDFDQVFKDYVMSLDKTKSGMPEIVENANDYFTPSMFDTAVSGYTGTKRNQFTKQLDEFMGDGFETQKFADTADDQYLDSIIGSQGEEALAALNRALARGTINDVGYKAGQSEYERQRKSGRAKAEDMGLGVIQGYRNQLKNEAKGIYGKVDKYELGDDFDVGKYQGQVDNLYGSLNSRLEGDILNAIGGTSFFDNSTMLGKAGTNSGILNNTPINTTSSGVATDPLAMSATSFDGRQALNTDEEKNKLKQTGVF